MYILWTAVWSWFILCFQGLLNKKRRCQPKIKGNHEVIYSRPGPSALRPVTRCTNGSSSILFSIFTRSSNDNYGTNLYVRRSDRWRSIFVWNPLLHWQHPHWPHGTNRYGSIRIESLVGRYLGQSISYSWASVLPLVLRINKRSKIDSYSILKL